MDRKVVATHLVDAEAETPSAIVGAKKVVTQLKERCESHTGKIQEVLSETLHREESWLLIAIEHCLRGESITGKGPQWITHMTDFLRHGDLESIRPAFFVWLEKEYLPKLDSVKFNGHHPHAPLGYSATFNERAIRNARAFARAIRFARTRKQKEDEGK